MKRKIPYYLLVVALLMVHCQMADAQIVIRDGVTVSQSLLIGTGLPLVDVVTVNGEEPACQYVTAPPGAWGMSITQATKVPGRLRIYQNSDSPVYDSGEYDEHSHGMTIKIRGNTSAYQDKKPFKIKLATSDDLLLRNDVLCMDRDWLLITDEELNVLSGLTLSKVLGMPWTPHFMYVNLVINNNYRGVYMLIESVKRNTNCRINVSGQGMLIEGDAYWWNEDFYIKSLLDSHYGFTFKYPDAERMSDADVAYFTDYLARFEQSLTCDNYEQYIDLNSFALWCLAQDILGSWDSGGTNRYYARYDRRPESLMVMPCLWDFDSNETTITNWSRCHTEHFTRLFNNSNPAFKLHYIRLWLTVCRALETEMCNRLNDFKESSQFWGLYYSTTYNNLRWNSHVVYSSILSQRAEWYGRRLPFLNKLVAKIHLPGDANIDGSVDVVDVNTVINCMLNRDDEKVIEAACDVNADGHVDIADINQVINLMLGAVK